MRIIILLFILSIVSFTLVSLSPIDPIQAYINGDLSVSVEQRAIIAERWGLNDPPVERYFYWLKNFVSGDMGTSLIFHRPVISIIKERFILSYQLMFLAWVLSGINGFLFGIWAAIKKDKLTDKLIKAYCLLLSSSPTFWIAMLMIIVFSVQFRIFPIGMAVPAGKLASEVTVLDRIYHLILPALTLSLTGISKLALHTRDKMIESLESEYALFAFARGRSKIEFVLHNGLRNVISPAITLHFMSIGELFGGSVLAETVFSYPGLGNATVEAGLQGDMPLLMGITLFGALFVFSGNLTANILYPIIDPRIKEGGYCAC